MNAPTPETEQDAMVAEASRIGAEHGRNAASWVFDGNTTDETYRRVLKGIEDIDPMVMDAYRVPSLSGEFSDDYSEADLALELTSRECWEQGHDATDHDAWDDAANAYNDAASEAFWSEVGRLAREHVDAADEQRKTDALSSDDFRIGYVDRADISDGHLARWVNWSRVYDYPSDGRETFVDLGRVAMGDDSFDQTDTVQRSNYRSLIRDYNDAETSEGPFVRISYSNTDGLGAFVSDLTDELVSILTGLVEQYPLYDESDLSELESEEITESYEQYERADIYRELGETTQEAWDALTSDAQRELFWSVVSDLDIYPEHDGHDVLWSSHEGAIAAEISRRLGTDSE